MADLDNQVSQCTKNIFQNLLLNCLQDQRDTTELLRQEIQLRSLLNAQLRFSALLETGPSFAVGELISYVSIL